MPSSHVLLLHCGEHSFEVSKKLAAKHSNIIGDIVATETNNETVVGFHFRDTELNWVKVFVDHCSHSPQHRRPVSASDFGTAVMTVGTYLFAIKYEMVSLRHRAKKALDGLLRRPGDKLLHQAPYTWTSAERIEFLYLVKDLADPEDESMNAWWGSMALFEQKAMERYEQI